MINDKKIEEAAKLHRFELIASMHGSTLGTPMQCSEEVVDAEIDLIENSFIAGAKWGINEFLKNLWHPASEEPRKDVSIIVETYNDENMFYYAWNRWQDNFYPSWTYAVFCSRVTRWLYIDDLFPKEGGNND